MQIYALTVLLTLSALHSLTDAAAENLAPTSDNHESQHNKIKRGNYDMLRWTRGLNMLRLGKRGDDNPSVEGNLLAEILRNPDPSQDTTYYEYLKALQNSYLYGRNRRGLNMLRLGKRGDVDENTENSLLAEILRNPDPSRDPSYYENLKALQSNYLHGRYRRSTPADDVSVTPIPLVSDDKEYLIDDNGLANADETYPVYIESDKDGELFGKRAGMGILRLGKRQLNMLRLGKRQLNMLRLGKRQLNMLRLGKRQLNMLRLGKRQLNMLRLGKRQLNMLRLGKRQLGEEGEKIDDSVDKRNLQMLRLG